MKSRALLILTALLCAAPVAATEAGEAARPDAAPVRATPFPDVPRDHWAFDAVEQLRRRGILRGYPPAPKVRRSGPVTPPPPRSRTANQHGNRRR